jgi:N-acetylmuramoyl-L-alanine amidase
VHILGQRSDKKSNTTDYFERNMSVAQRENEVIVMEEGYETKYPHFDPSTPEAYIGYALQWKAHYESSLLFASEVVNNLMVKPLQARKIAIDQDIFQVLVEANMPAVLLEIAFISNPTEYKYLASKSGQEEVAERLFKAFKSYKTKYDMSLNVEAGPLPVPVETPQTDKVVEEPTSFYAVQIMSVAKLLKSDDPQFKGLKAEPYKPQGVSTYKYIVGKFRTREQANDELKKVKAKFPQAFIIYVDNN